MSAPPKCPGCGSPLQPDWENCPNCPMSFADEAPPENVFKSSVVRDVIMPGLFFAALALGVWSIGQFLWNQSRTSAQAPEAAPPRQAAAPAEPAMNVKAEIDRLDRLSREKSGEVDISKPDDEDEGAASISITASDSPIPRAKAVREWKLRGVVYDLLTLKPIPRCSLIFADYVTNARADVLTDSQGRYRIILPPLSERGYLVSIQKKEYEKAYLNPGTEGVREMTETMRRELVHELSTTLAQPSSVQPYSEAPLVTDFYLAPKR